MARKASDSPELKAAIDAFVVRFLQACAMDCQKSNALRSGKSVWNFWKD